MKPSNNRRHHLSVVGNQPEPVNDSATLETYAETLHSPKTYARVAQGITRLCKLRNFAIREPVHLGFMLAQDGPQYGTVHPITTTGPNKQLTIGTSANFPKSLEESARIVPNRAVTIAADFVIAYGIFVRGQMLAHQPKSRTFEGSMQPGLWEPEYNIDGGPARAVLYRAAGAVALQTHGLDQIVMKDNVAQPLPPHMAALVNPLDRADVASMHDFARKGA